MSLEKHRAFLEDGIAQIQARHSGFQLQAHQVQQLLDYGAMILKWNRIYNLTAIRSEQELMTHHLLDSLAVVPHIQAALRDCESPRVLDVGSGAGLPGLVIAICQPGWTVHTLDTVQKKAAFMQQACAVLKLSCAQSVHQRVEQYQPSAPYDLICSRAFSSLQNFIDWSQHLLSPDGLFAAMKGKLEVDQEVPQGWHTEQVLEVNVPFLPVERHLFLIKR